MDDNTIVAVITGIAGLVTIFFGRAYWSSFKKLIDGSQLEVERLRLKVEAMQVQIDSLERELMSAIKDRATLLARIESCNALADRLTAENARLAREVSHLENIVRQYRPVRGDGYQSNTPNEN